MGITRLIRVEDAAKLADVLKRNVARMSETLPPQLPAFYTEAGQLEVIEAALEGHEAGTRVPHVILNDDGKVVGRTAINEITWGPLESASLGYFVDERFIGRGLASRAATKMVAIAFDELGLHRLEAGTLPENIASIRVLQKAGFRQYGCAESYIRIAGAWQDSVFYERLSTGRSHDCEPNQLDSV